MKPTKHNLLHSAIALTGMTLSASALPITWDNSGTDFNAGASWDGDAAPGVDDVATFDEAAVTQPGLTADTSVLGVNFTAGGYTLSGANTLTVGTSGITNGAGLTNTISSALTLSAANTVTNGAGSLLTLGVINTTGGLSIGGGGTVLLSANGDGTLVGGVTIGTGTTVQIGNNRATGANNQALTINGGTISTDGISRNLQQNGARVVTISGGATLQGINNTGLGRIGNINGSGGLTITIDGTAGAASQFFLDGTGSSYTGDTTISNGAIARAKGSGVFGNTAGTVTLDNASIISNGANQNYASGRIYNIGAGGALLRAGDSNEGSVDTYSNVQGAGQLTIGSQGAVNSTIALSGTNTFSGDIEITSDTVGGNLRVTGSLGSGASYGGVISGGGNLEYAGSGTQTLTGVSSYTGNTTVTSGTLVIDGNIVSSTLTTVASGATIGGSGSTGALTIESGGFHNPGNSPGIMNVNGNYSLAGTLVAEITSNTAGIGGYDQVNVMGDVVISGALDAMFTGGTYTAGDLLFLVTNDGSDAVTGTFTGLAQGAVVTNFGGFDWAISYLADSVGITSTGGNDIALVAVPEPSAALLGALGVLALLRRRRA
ncbi:MAG: hypothetical protein NWT08_15250 [Akkermansiaceae bacterium]|jgi:autotransporter-associated beta strand protein|nr:hypothetical protein [Akkermansiaceae bacterium]MDP4646534.1 hypothetical protein [Akkermansiaceae bacterium]MDP4721004.1 hypothetical protein [Akkermansiaceae bacterium]MDP4781088.1 hypothetical protein [Akkermansiaceae bacterium]MDP4846469.1 hypothetical protein [Akkermansiaceae bacterium]